MCGARIYDSHASDPDTRVQGEYKYDYNNMYDCSDVYGTWRGRWRGGPVCLALFSAVEVTFGMA